MNDLFFSHKSIRKYLDKPVPEDVLTYILEAGIKASNTGNMQLYSVIVNTDADTKKELAPFHFNQTMVTQAPVLLTFCADVHRFSKWCEYREASPGYNNLLWFINAATDCLLLSQNVSLAAESKGLGICYLGTTLYNADKLIDYYQLPKGVFPITSIVVGYPDGDPGLTDRLPLNAIVHQEKYHDYTEDSINQLYQEKENLALTKKLLLENNKKTLAQVFTDNRYKKQDNEFFSEKILNLLYQQGFMDNQLTDIQ